MASECPEIPPVIAGYLPQSTYRLIVSLRAIARSTEIITR